MTYDPEKDEYTYQNGKKLRVVYIGKRKSCSGFEVEITYYECEDCAYCPEKPVFCSGGHWGHVTRAIKGM